MVVRGVWVDDAVTVEARSACGAPVGECDQRLQLGDALVGRVLLLPATRTIIVVVVVAAAA